MNIFTKKFGFIKAQMYFLLHKTATISKEADHVPVSASNLLSSKGVYLRQLEVLRVTPSQVSRLHNLHQQTFNTFQSHSIPSSLKWRYWWKFCFGCRVALVSQTSQKKTLSSWVSVIQSFTHLLSVWACRAVIMTWLSSWEALIYGSGLSLKPPPSLPPPAITSDNICSL